MRIIGIFIVILLSLYYIFGGLTMLRMSIKTIKELKKNSKNKIELKNNYYVILPVLREQSIICDSIDYFYNLIKDEQNIKIFITTTEREDEKYVNCLQNTTYEIAKCKIKELKASSRIILLKSPSEYEGKVGQMNYTYEYIMSNESEGIIGVYDIDSRPPKEIFYTIERLQKKENINSDIYQQVSSYCEGIEQLKGISGDFAIADALSQTRWAIGFEYPIYKLYYKSHLNGNLRPLVYCIGHGCFIKTEYLKRIGGFPTFNKNDDLSLGYLTSTLNASIYPIPLLDFCQISRTALNSIKQYKFWFTGSSKYYEDINYYELKYKTKVEKNQKILFKIEGALRNFLWAWRSNLIIINLLLSLCIDSKICIIMSLLSILVYVVIPYYVTYFEIKKIKKIKIGIKTLFFAPIISVINFIIRGIGPCIAMVTGSKRKNNVEYKTER